MASALQKMASAGFDSDDAPHRGALPAARLRGPRGSFPMKNIFGPTSLTSVRPLPPHTPHLPCHQDCIHTY